MARRMRLLVVVLVAAGVAGLSGCRVGTAEGGGADDGGPVPLEAPVIVAAPSSMTVAAGLPLVLTVTATGDELSYQWEQDAGGGWTPVPGETGETWTTEALSSGDDGLAVRCVVTNSLGEDASERATLTVRRVRMVRPGGTGTGTSWDDALPGVAEATALTAADVDEVWVAAGRYLPAGSDRYATFTLPSAVALYGGFAGGEQGREERDPAANETVLSGDVGTTGVAGDNAYHVVSSTAGGYLDGFTVRDGRADGATYPDDHGGGLYFDGASPTVAGCHVTGNLARIGGGGYLRLGRPVLLDCLVEGNGATVAAGGLSMWTQGSTVTDCTFAANASGGEGGALDLQDYSVFLRCRFEDNVAAGVGGGLYVGAGRPTLRDCVLRGNTAVVGGAVFGRDTIELAMTNCEFSLNSATLQGGAMYFIQSGFAVSTLRMVNCTLVGNVGPRAGGIVSDDASFHITNCLVWNNDTGGVPQLDLGFASGLVKYSCVEGGYTGTGNVSGDPRFVDEAGGDYRIGAGSSCIDGADGAVAPELDMDGLPRWDDPTVTGVDSSPYADIGAHEYQGF